MVDNFTANKLLTKKGGGPSVPGGHTDKRKEDSEWLILQP
jgi:hypothetical protein